MLQKFSAMTQHLSFKYKRNFFLRRERHHRLLHSPWAGGLVLVIFAALAMILANIPATAEVYHHLLESHLTVGFDHFKLSKPLEAWINDGLMVLFFFYVGLEIKREIMAGHLSTIRQAALPIAAAIGGMIVPALIYTGINLAGGEPNGWGVPMATDIAFAIGVLSLLGNRVPVSLKIFLTALAVADDLGGILVIALFYSTDIRFEILAIIAGVFLLMILLRKFNVYKMRYYLILSIIIWILFLYSGIHATIAGVLIALTIPSTPRYTKRYFLYKTQFYLDSFRQHNRDGVKILSNKKQLEDIETIRQIAVNAISPSQRLEYALHHMVSFFIMPIFALANAGIRIEGLGDLDVLFRPLGAGIFLGLVLGKPIGIFLFSRLAVYLKWGELPEGTTWPMIFGVSCLGGIGFTMSIFINNLAFTNPAALTGGKISILLASLTAGVIGWGVTRIVSPRKNHKNP